MKPEAKTDVDLKDFSKRAIEALGGVFEEPSANRLDALLPEDAAPSLRERNPLKLLFFAQDGVRGAHGGPDEELFVVGSPLLDALTGPFFKKGGLAKAYVNSLGTDGGDLDQKFSKKFRLNGARSVLACRSREETADALFHFKIAFLTDDRTERLIRVAVNLATGLENEGLLKTWDHLFLDPAPSHALPPFPLPDLRKPYERALESARRRVEPDVDGIRAFQKKLLKRDLARIDDYYGDLFEELERKKNRAQGQNGRDQVQDLIFQRIEQRKRSLAADHAEKRRDSRVKHRIEVHVEPVNLLVVHRSWTRAVFRLKTHREELERPFFWDPVLKDFADAACEICGSLSTCFSVRDRRLACPKCSA